MQSRKQLIVIGVLGLILVGIAYVVQEQEPPTAEVVTNRDDEQKDIVQAQGTTTTQAGLEVGVELGTNGTVMEVDTTQVAADGPVLITIRTDSDSVYKIAVPSMSLPLCAAIKNIAVVTDILPGDKISVRGKTDETGQIIPCENETHELKVRRFYADPAVGLTFIYQISPEGYLLQTEGYPFSTDPSFVSGVLLTSTKDATEMTLGDVPGEFPPVIKLRVYNNPEKLSPVEWTKKNGSESNYKLALAEPVEISVGKSDAVGYTTDGLYLTDTYVVGYGDRILVVTGEYIDTDSAIFTDLEELVKTISLEYH